MGVQVDEPRRNQLAAHVYGSRGPRRIDSRCNSGNASARNSNVRDRVDATAGVEDASSGQNQIVGTRVAVAHFSSVSE